MSEKKTDKQDLRIRYTRQALAKSLIALLREKSIEKITVKELCLAAGVNRSTFYAHYSDISALMRQLADEMKMELTRHMEAAYPGVYEYRSSLIRFLCFIKENAQIYLTLISETGQNSLQEQIWRIITAKRLKGSTKNDVVSELKEELILAGHANGVTAILKVWLKKGQFITEEEIADLIIRFTEQGIS